MFNGMVRAAAPVEAAFKYLNDITELNQDLNIYIDETKKRLRIYLQDKSRINLKILLDNEKALLEKINSNIKPNVNKLKSKESSVNNSYYALSESIGKKRNVLEGLRIQILNHERELSSTPQRGIIPGNVAYMFPEKYNGFLLSPDHENITRAATATPVNAATPATPVNAATAATMANVSPLVLNQGWKIFPTNQRNPKDVLDQLLGKGSNTLEPTFKALLKEKRGEEKRGTVTDAFLLDAIEKTYERFQEYITDIGTNDEEFRTELKKKYVNLLTSDKLNSFEFILHSFLRLQRIFNPNMYLRKPPANKMHTKNEHSHTSNTPYYKKILLDDEFIGFCSMEQNIDVMQKILNFLETNQIGIFNFISFFLELKKIIPETFTKEILAILSVKSFACVYIKRSSIGGTIKSFLEINCSSSGGARTRRVPRVRRTLSKRRTQNAPRVQNAPKVRNAPKVPRVRRTQNARKVSRV